MSLGRLLATGKSLVSVRDDQNRFHASRRVSLPKFGPSKNPFAPTSNKEVDSAQMVIPGTPDQSLTHQAADTAARAASWFKTVISAARVAVPTGMWRWFRERGRTLNPFRRLARKSTAIKIITPRIAKTPVQGELSLDKVKVVRNDLTDADVVVVQVRSSSKGETAESVLQTTRKDSAGERRMWNRFATRIFGADVT